MFLVGLVGQTIYFRVQTYENLGMVSIQQNEIKNCLSPQNVPKPRLKSNFDSQKVLTCLWWNGEIMRLENQLKDLTNIVKLYFFTTTSELHILKAMQDLEKKVLQCSAFQNEEVFQNYLTTNSTNYLTPDNEGIFKKYFFFVSLQFLIFNDRKLFL